MNNIVDIAFEIDANFRNFHGRARRSEFWWYYLFECIINFGLSGLSNATGIKAFVWGILVLNVVLFIPGLALLFRRMHDTGKSGQLTALFYLSRGKRRFLLPFNRDFYRLTGRHCFSNDGYNKM